jgi:hypothetical protein
MDERTNLLYRCSKFYLLHISIFPQLEAQLQHHYADLLAACDQGRDVLETALHIKIDDMGAMSKWTKKGV